MNTAALRMALVQAGLRVNVVTLHYENEKQIIIAAGWHPDGTAFDAASEPFTGAPLPAATELAARIIADHRLKTAIDHRADRIASATVIARAINGNKPMSLAEKIGNLAARAHAVPKALEARADKLLPRIDALEHKGGAAFDGLETVLKDAEDGVTAAENAVRTLTNTPLSSSGGSPKD